MSAFDRPAAPTGRTYSLYLRPSGRAADVTGPEQGDGGGRKTDSSFICDNVPYRSLDAALHAMFAIQAAGKKTNSSMWISAHERETFLMWLCALPAGDGG